MKGDEERAEGPPGGRSAHPRSPGDPGPRTFVLGVVGTFVLDRIVGLSGREKTREELGGIAYALSAVSAALPAGWRARPVARVGEDASERVRRWLQGLDARTGRLVGEDGRVDAGDDGLLDGGLDGIVDVPEPNNRVELRYHDDTRRTEHLTGGVGGWRWEALATVLDGCDALLINFISGHELGLEGLRRLRDTFTGPVYADLHSLFLDTAEDGTRVPRRLPGWRDWVACFDAVQMNADELDLLRGATDVDATVTEALRLGPALFVCTRGGDGAVCWWSPDAESRFAGGGRARRPGDGSVARREIPAVQVADPDPTGCGDVWGAAMVCRLLAGEPVTVAARAATRLAGAAAGWSGVEGLPTRLAETLDEHLCEAVTSEGGEEH